MILFRSGGRRASAVTPHTRHALEFIADEVVADGPAPDLFVVDAFKRAVLEDIPRLPQPLIAAVRSGRTRLVLDSSGEGAPFSRAWTTKLHRELETLGLNTGRVVYLTQNRIYEAKYRRWAADVGATPMTVLTHDYYIRALFHPFVEHGETEYALRLADYRARPPKRSRRFVCLNYSARDQKVLLLLRLIRDGLWDQGHISFSGFDRTVNTRAARRDRMEASIAAFSGFEDLAAELLPHMDALQAKGCVMFGPLRRASNAANHFKDLLIDMPLEQYGDAWFTVVTETEMDGHRMTEKPFKAMLNFSPTLILGSRGEADRIREFGFRTFDGLIDEAYDRERDHRARFEQVYAELTRLCALSEAEWAELERRMEATLIHNAHWGLTEAPARFVEIDARLAARLLEA